jgi:cell division protein FtsI (penicillin-binding protein 3)
MTLLLPVAIGFQMLRIQVFEGQALRDLWSAQAIDVIPIPSQRGNILDSRGRILVSNTVTYSVAIDPLVPNTRPEQIAQILDTLAAHTNRSASEYRRRMQQAPAGSRYIVLDRNVPRSAYVALRELRLRNTILEENYRRRHNYNQLAAHVLGYVNHEVRGQMGLEASYERILRGRDGEQQVQRDRLGRIRSMVGAPRRQPIEGHTLKTTIDAHIQAIVEEELREGVRRTRSNYGSVIVVDPRTGAVKAMANYPTFNPNNLRPEEAQHRRNFAISDMIEPGSTFKLVTAVAAVEQNLVTLDEIFVTPENGVQMIHGQAMRDHNPLGTLDFENVIKKSSNIATAEVAMRLPRETFFQYARNMGFGTHTGIDLILEEAGRMQRPYQWSAVTLPWMSIGYEVQVTPLQMVMAYAAFANNGNLMRPYIVDEVHDEFGNIIQKTRPITIRRAIRPETIRKLMPAFEGVVTEDGTAQFASIEGITIGGKTGTAQKFIDGRYQTRYRASFIGFYPTDEPRYVVMVLLDEPRTSIYGGFVSGPIFRQITSRIMGLDEHLQREIVDVVEQVPVAQVPMLRGMSAENAMASLQHLRVRFSTEGEGKLVVAQSPEPGSNADRSTRVTLTLGNPMIQIDESNERVRSEVPELRGMSMRQAVLALTTAGFEIQQVGSGTVYAQFPQPGSLYENGREVTIRGRARSMNVLTSATAGGN